MRKGGGVLLVSHTFYLRQYLTCTVVLPTTESGRKLVSFTICFQFCYRMCHKAKTSRSLAVAAETLVLPEAGGEECAGCDMLNEFEVYT